MLQPLAERLRPKNLDEYIGQEHLVGPGAVLRRMIDGGKISSFILWGPPGVGKTTLAHIISQQLQAPFFTLSAVQSGVKEVREVIDRCKANIFSKVRPILFIDEIHIIAGAGAAEGAIDAASILKPMLARGEIQLIGATTPEEYRKTIQKDSALERRFGRVMVEEPTPAAAETILAGLMPRYERYHGVSIPPEAIHAAVELSVRYLPGRYLPDKAIDLLDEAAAARRIADASGNRRALTPADIARVVSKASGVPAERVGEAERERLANLEQRLAAEVIGQPQAVAAVASAIRRSRTGLRESGRPIGAMLFLGPTGVGKTQLARTLAKCWFGSEKALLRFDMSEYMERHTVARLLGAPPGYVGHDEGGQLTEAVRRHPYSVVLFDEVEKAHPDVFNILLQILDDGRITDSQGRTVDFKNTIIILTSNLGSSELLDGIQPDGSISESARAAVMGELRRAFRPEFLNRLDEIIMFKPLTKENLSGIIDILMEGLKKRLADKTLKLEVTDAAKSLIIERGFDPIYGARPLKRYLQSAAETLIAKEILRGDLAAGSTLVLDAENGELSCRKK